MRIFSKFSTFCICLFTLAFISCEINQNKEVIVDKHPTSLKQERTQLSFDSFFIEFPIENKLQYFELLSYKDNPLVLDPTIQDYDDSKIYKVSFDRSCMLEYDPKKQLNKLYRSTKRKGEAILKLEANNPEFDKLTIPISMEDGILFFDRVKGVEIYKEKADKFVKTWEHAHKDAQSKPSTNIIYNVARKRIEYYDKDVEEGNFQVKYYDFYSDEPKISEVELNAERIIYLRNTNVYLSKFSDHVLLHPSGLTEIANEELENYKLPHYPGEIAIYNSNRNFKKELSSKFGYEITKAKVGFETDKSEDNVIRGIYTHLNGISIFSVKDQQLYLEDLPLAYNESKTSRLFVTKDFVGSVIYETNTPGQYSNETKISNIRLLIYSYKTGDLFEVPFPKELELAYDIITIGEEVYIFNKERYYNCRLSGVEVK